MALTTMREMWTFLDVYTVDASGQERVVNHLNEWGGFSKRLNVPVFTAWSDHVAYDRLAKTTTAKVSDTTWTSAVGVDNQEHWLDFAEKSARAEAAFFVIYTRDISASPRQVQSIDNENVYIGNVVRDGTTSFIVGTKKALKDLA